MVGTLQHMVTYLIIISRAFHYNVEKQPKSTWKFTKVKRTKKEQKMSVNKTEEKKKLIVSILLVVWLYSCCSGLWIVYWKLMQFKRNLKFIH